MSNLPVASGKAVVRALQRAGFSVSHTRGGHYYLRREASTRLVVVPVHGGSRDLPPGTMRSILRQAELTADDLRTLL